MKLYETGLDDVRVHRMWEQMMLSGDMKNFPPCFAGLTIFLNMVQRPTTFLFEEDDLGIWFAMWLEPSTWDFGIISMWIREDKRQSGKLVMPAISLALHHFFTKVSMIVAYTIQPRLIEEYTNFGCELRGVLPRIAFGEDAFMFTMTREQFAAKLAGVDLREESE